MIDIHVMIRQFLNTLIKQNLVHSEKVVEPPSPQRSNRVKQSLILKISNHQNTAGPDN